MSDSPFTDEIVGHYVKVVQTQHGIVHVAEEMAKVLAEMGRASGKAVGDHPAFAIQRWSDLIRKRAIELLHVPETESCRHPKAARRLPSPGT